MTYRAVTVTGLPSLLKYHIPGFVRIDEFRQINNRGDCEFDIVFDDTKVHEVTEVRIKTDSSSPELPPNAYDKRLGTIRIASGTIHYLYWFGQVVPPEYDGVSVMVVAGTPDRLDFYVPGFMRIDHYRQLEDERVELHVVYDPKRTSEIHHLAFRTWDNDPDPVPSPSTLGIYYRRAYGGWSYLRYEDTIVAPPAN
ncbi:hypothetical protein [Nocardia sp. NPDC052566]|uniref:hypothetical protein n=1 Tax=Nocardia sp. NPDC052566 TaxID=3364330 RepID=UPI0037C69A5E